MKPNHYTINQVSNNQFDLYYHGDYVGESTSLANAQTMQDNHDKRREPDPTWFLLKQAS